MNYRKSILNHAYKCVKSNKYKDALYYYEQFKKLNPELSSFIDVNERIIKKCYNKNCNLSNIYGDTTANKKHKISVIVPVFNCERYIEKCIYSILEQTFEDIEIICVDDCSTDSSFDILKKIKRLDDRIVLAHHDKNKGLGGARNTGIMLSNSKYIASVDADDYIEKNMLDVLYRSIKENNSCISVCGYKRVSEDGVILDKKIFKNKIISSDDLTFDIFNTSNPAFWNKLWKKELFVSNNIFFPEKVFYQDLATTPRIYANIKNISFIEECPYYYLVRRTSATMSNTPKHIYDYYAVFNILEEFLFENNIYERYKKSFILCIERACRFRIENIMRSEIDFNEKKIYTDALSSIYNYYTQLNREERKKNFLKKIDLYNEKIDISIIVKTINRPESLRRFLESCMKYQKKYNIVFNEILIGDDSNSNFMKYNKIIICDIIDKYKAENIKYIEFEYDIGASCGRNRLVRTAISNFIMVCDDDFILDLDCNIKSAFILLKNKNLDILGGWLKNKYNIKTGDFEYRYSYGFFYTTKDCLHVDINEDKYDIKEFVKCHFIMQFFIAKKALYYVILGTNI